ncbi:hypothetical protein GGI43DRAFT_385091 [Trichoderma evansii]
MLDLKAMREERKWELIEEKKEQQKHKERVLNEEDTLVKKIQAAIEAVREAESRGDAPAPFTSVANKTFKLYCVDHVEYCFYENYSSKHVSFHYHVPDKGYGRIAKEPPNSDTKIYGQIDLTSPACASFEEWLPPKEAGPKIYSIKDRKGKFEFTFQFISNGYLIATVPREFVFLDAAVDPLAPETFTMYGASSDIARKWDEEKRSMAGGCRVYNSSESSTADG